MADNNEQDTGVSALASRFEKPADDAPAASRITDIASKFQSKGGSSSVPSFKPNTPASSAPSSGAAAVAARNAPVKEATDEEAPAKSVADVAARFSAAAKVTEDETESSFSAAKGAFQKAEASRPADTETKVMGVASMFGDTTAKKPGRTPVRNTSTKKSTFEDPSPSRVSTEKGPGVPAAAAMFQSGNASGSGGGDGDGEPEESSSERFANAAKMFGGK